MKKISETQKLFLKKMGGPKERGGGFKRGFSTEKGKEGTNCKRRETCGVCLVFVSGRKEERSWVGLGWCVNGGDE